MARVIEAEVKKVNLKVEATQTILIQKRKGPNHEAEENLLKGLGGIAQFILKMKNVHSQTMVQL